jgi:hypothetical protein
MYNNRNAIKVVDPFYVIHLLRDPYDTALSACRNALLRKLYKSQYRAHRKRGAAYAAFQDEPDPVNVQMRSEGIKNMQKGMKTSFLPNLEIPVLEVTYEEMTNRGNDIERLPRDISFMILSFLNVDPEVELTTYLQKTS